jgi:hypothetical protein
VQFLEEKKPLICFSFMLNMLDQYLSQLNSPTKFGIKFHQNFYFNTGDDACGLMHLREHAYAACMTATTCSVTVKKQEEIVQV